MEWLDTCTPPSTRDGVLGTLDLVRERLADAQLTLRTALGTETEWVSVAADGYRARISDRMAELRMRAGRVDALEGILSGATNARANVPGV